MKMKGGLGPHFDLNEMKLELKKAENLGFGVPK